MRRVNESVPLDVCKARCLIYMASNGHVGVNPMRMSDLGLSQTLWPEVVFVAAPVVAVARVLRVLRDEGLVVWKVIGEEGPRGGDWGYVLTTAGIRAVGKAATEMAMMEDDQP